LAQVAGEPRGQEFVIAGYIPNGAVVDSLLVGYYEGRYLMYAGSVRAGLPIEFRRVLVPHLDQLQIAGCPFVNLPDRTEGRWGEGLTAAKMVACCWLHPFLVAPSSVWNGPLRNGYATLVSLESVATERLARSFANNWVAGLTIRPGCMVYFAAPFSAQARSTGHQAT
jgi:hypothetical protein